MNDIELVLNQNYSYEAIEFEMENNSQYRSLETVKLKPIVFGNDDSRSS